MAAAFQQADTFFNDLLAQATGRPAPTIVAASTRPHARKLCEADVETIVDRQRDLTARPFEIAYSRADTDPHQADELDRLLYDYEQDAEATRTALEAREMGGSDSPFNYPAEVADFIIRTEAFDAPVGSQDRGKVVAAVRRGMKLGHDLISKLGTGDAMPRTWVKGKLASSVRNAKPSGSTIREAMAAYLKQGQFPAKTVSEANLSLTIFEKVVGNKSVAALTKADFIQFVQHLSEQETGGKTVGSVKRHLSSQTITKRLGFIRSSIQRLIDQNAFDGINPAAGIKVDAFAKKIDRAKLPVKQRFMIDELNRLFQHPWFTGCESATSTHKAGGFRLRGSEYWVPVVALMTGCRAGELGGLLVSDVRLNNPHPHIVIQPNEHRRLKTENSTRNVPILDTLMELGFAEYVLRQRAAGSARLFPDRTPVKNRSANGHDDNAWSNAKIIRAFNRTVLRAQLGDKSADGARQHLTFHSFRGTSKAMLGGPDYRLHPNYIDEVVSHEKSELDGRYVGTLTIEETYPAIKGCRYRGFVIPKAY